MTHPAYKCGSLCSDEHCARCPFFSGGPVVARVGDTIGCDVRQPYPQVIAVTLKTQAAVDYANERLLTRPHVWRLIRQNATS